MSWWSRHRNWSRLISIIVQLVGMPFFFFVGCALVTGEELAGFGFFLAGCGIAALLVTNLGWASSSVRRIGWLLIILGPLVALLLEVKQRYGL